MLFASLKRVNIMKTLFSFLSMILFGNIAFSTIQNLRTEITISELERRDYTIIKLLPEDNQSQWIVQIPNGVVFNEGGVLTEDGYILQDAAIFPNAHGLKNKRLDLNQENPMHFKGRLAIIASSGSENWYHWLLQILPRLYILSQSKIAYNRIYINNIRYPWQVKSLEAVLEHLNIPRDKLLVINGDCVLQAETLIVPSIPFRLSFGFSKKRQFPSWMQKFLGDVFLLKTNTESRRYEKIYISRSKASMRRIINEAELVNALKKQGFQILHLEEMSPFEQARAFAQAKVIAGPHGSGFANLIFATPGYTLIEIDHSSDPLRSCFKPLTRLTSGNYHGFYVDHVSEEDLEKDMYVNIPTFLEFLKKYT